MSGMQHGGPWRWRWGWSRLGRPPKPRLIWFRPRVHAFVPVDELGRPIPGEPVYLLPDELEALRLVYYEGLTQEEAAKRMNVSRGTLWRALASGRKKLVQALIEGKPLVLVAPEERPDREQKGQKQYGEDQGSKGEP